jgi:phage gpG-like protein
MLTAKLVNGESLIANTNAFTAKMMARLRVIVARIAVEMVARVKADKLSDQVLHVRTGRLRRSITYRMEEGKNTAKAVVGTNLAYGRAQEYGFSGVVSVREHMRRTKTGDTTVRAHTMRMNLPERSYLRSTLSDMKDDIAQRITDAVLHGKGVEAIA